MPIWAYVPVISLVQLHRKVDKIMADIDDVKAAIAKAEDTEDKAIALLQGLKASLDAAIANNDMGAVKALTADLGTHTDALAAEIAKDTPPAPTP